MLPSMRVMVRLAKNRPNSHNRMPEPTSANRSKLVIPVKCSGVMVALQPNTKKILNKLLPMAFPMAISGFFFRAATMDVASSGRDVPPATRVSPMTDSLAPKLRAMPLAPFTNRSPPTISAPRPPTMYRTDRHIGSWLTFSSVSPSCFPWKAMENVYPKKMTKKQSNNNPSVVLGRCSVRCSVK